MYSRRLKIFIVFCLVLVSVCLFRLFVMQSGDSREKVLETIEAMRDVPPVQLPTLRGKIVDRKGRLLAVDQPRFYLYVNYNLTRLLDERWQFARLIYKFNKGLTEEEARAELQEEFAEDTETLYRLIDFCSELPGHSEEEVLGRIKKINDRVWWLRGYVGFKKYNPGGNFSEYKKTAPYLELIKMAARERIIEMNRNHSLIELEGEDQKFNAELNFADSDKIVVSTKPVRHYPYGQTASQVLGWVKPKVDAEDDELGRFLASDPLASYQGQELAGFKGVEWVCEPYLRGRRGQIQYNRDGDLVDETSTQFGNDIGLTIDIELQRDVEQVLVDSAKYTDFYSKAKAAVLLDIETGQILTIASVPRFDLNKVRIDYSKYFNDPNRPFENKALEKIYPAGSTLKPLIILAALEEGKVNTRTVISCPARKAPKGWPSCWIWRHASAGHDYQWSENNARNAIKGSCNIFCSRAADMLDGRDLQKWLYNFGFGRRLMPSPGFTSVNIESDKSGLMSRKLREAGGIIWSGYPSSYDKPLDELKKIKRYEKRMFGIGQGSMRTTVLQVANEMAVIARDGVFKDVKLYDDNSATKFVNLGIQASTIATVKDGMYAVVNETNGTAKKAFKNFDMKKVGVQVYGKTGSTQGPECAWFSGFFKDDQGRAIAMALIVEGGESGSQHAAPLGVELVKLCVKHGYVGHP